MKTKQETVNESSGNRLKRLLNVKDAAHYLGISQAAVYKYVEVGMLACRRLTSIPTKKQPKAKSHGRIVFELADLDGFIDDFSERRESHFKIKIREKTLDNVN